MLNFLFPPYHLSPFAHSYLSTFQGVPAAHSPFLFHLTTCPHTPTLIFPSFQESPQPLQPFKETPQLPFSFYQDSVRASSPFLTLTGILARSAFSFHLNPLSPTVTALDLALIERALENQCFIFREERANAGAFFVLKIGVAFPLKTSGTFLRLNSISVNDVL